MPLFFFYKRSIEIWNFFFEMKLFLFEINLIGKFISENEVSLNHEIIAACFMHVHDSQAISALFSAVRACYFARAGSL